MSTSTNLSLPFLQEAQAQKHVTVNEALLALDEVVQLRVESRTIATPPGAPQDGDRYVVPADASGSWTGWDTSVAVFRDGAWLERNPSVGWIAYAADEASILVYTGVGWQSMGSSSGAGSAPETAQFFGINATADVTNRLSVRSDAVLFDHEGNGTQVKINKAAPTDTASLIFQTDYSGRAEFGLVGSDTFAVKVSADGSNFVEGFSVDASGAFMVGANIRVWRGLADDPTSLAIGPNTAVATTTGIENVGVGYDCLRELTAGVGNAAVGARAGRSVTTGHNNVLVGRSAGANLATGDNNLFVGSYAGQSATTAGENVFVGQRAGRDNVGGVSNVFLGANAGQTSLGDRCTALGRNALATSSPAALNVTAVGFNAQITGSHQVQLGNADTSVYAYGAVQNRSDARDKADVRDTLLGLSFVDSLRPVDFRWNLRENYKEDENGDTPVPGSLTRTRFHHGFVAQEVAAVIQASGLDFGGYQDHTIAGGTDVQSLGYTEFIAPLVRAVQELSARVKALEAASG